MLKNFNPEGEVIELESGSSYFNFILERTDDVAVAKFIFFGRDTFVSLFFMLTLFSLGFSSLTAAFDVSFCVAANLLMRV